MIDNLYYNLDHENKTAELTYLSESPEENENYLDSSYHVFPSIIEYSGNQYTVTSIGDNAFYGCRYLWYATLPNTITKIGNYAFAGTSVQELDIPRSLTSIGEMAFWGNIQLSYIFCHSQIPPTIHENTFEPVVLKKFTSVFVEEGCLTNYFNDENWRNFENIFERIQRGDLYFLIHPENQTAEVTFSHYSNLWNTTYVTGEIEIPSHVEYFGAQYPVSAILRCAFERCKITSMTIPPTVNNIETYAFAWCEELKSVSIPNSIQHIPDNAFYNCYSLTSVEIPESVSTIGCWAFQNCTSLKSIKLPELLEDSYIYFDKYNSNNSYIRNSAALFIGCESLESVIIPEHFTFIGAYMFRDCYNLTSVTIPEDIYEIKPNAFESCRSLKFLTIPDNVGIIGPFAFCDCRSLISLSLPPTLTNIEEGLFLSCTNLRSIEIPDQVTSIERIAFAECSKLKNVTIPNSVTMIKEDAFSNCHSLQAIYCYAKMPPQTDNDPFGDEIYRQATLYVPSGSLSQYNNADYWKNFNTIEEMQAGGVDEILGSNNLDIIGYYNLQGIKSTEPWSGINIVIYSDGSCRRIFY